MENRIPMILLCAILLSAMGLALVPPGRALACSCAKPPAVKEELANKTAVFAGKAEKVVKPKQGAIWSSATPVKVTFRVTEVWKGKLAEETVVSTALSSASCGYDGFEANKEYIVFAHGPLDRLETTICSRTKPLASAGSELTALGTGYKPEAQTRDAEAKGAKPGLEVSVTKSQSMQAIGSLAVILAAAAGVLVVRRRRRRP